MATVVHYAVGLLMFFSTLLRIECSTSRLCPKYPYISTGRWNCTNSNCVVECLGLSRPRYPGQHYTCTVNDWSPKLPDGFRRLACYNPQLPESLTYSLQISLSGKCQEPVDEFSSELEKRVVGPLNEKVENLCGAPYITSCDLSNVSVNCAPAQTSARDADIAIHMTFEATFSKIANYIMFDYEQVKEFWSSGMLQYLQTLRIVIQGHRVRATSARGILTSMICPSGHIKMGGACAICPEGTFLSNKTGVCVACPANTYQYLPGQYECLDCEEGAKADPGSFSCYTSASSPASCPSGHYRSRETKDCSECPMGTYQPSPNNENHCLSCREGFTSFSGSSECFPPNIFHNSEFSAGGVVGIVFGTVAVVSVLVIAMILYVRRRRVYGDRSPVLFNSESYP